MSSERLNDATRLKGDAKVRGLVQTVELFELTFSVWSKSNQCAAADIAINESGRRLYGVVYEIPDFLLTRDTAELQNRISMDRIEGEGTNYVRRPIHVEALDGKQFTAITYVVKNPQSGLQTSLNYVKHILKGLAEHKMPDEYQKYVTAQICLNNPALRPQLQPVKT